MALGWGGARLGGHGGYHTPYATVTGSPGGLGPSWLRSFLRDSRHGETGGDGVDSGVTSRGQREVVA